MDAYLKKFLEDDENAPLTEAAIGESTRAGPYVPEKEKPVVQDATPGGSRFNDLADMRADLTAKTTQPSPGSPGYVSRGAPMPTENIASAENGAAGDKTSQVAALRRVGKSDMDALKSKDVPLPDDKGIDFEAGNAAMSGKSPGLVLPPTKSMTDLDVIRNQRDRDLVDAQARQGKANLWATGGNVLADFGSALAGRSPNENNAFFEKLKQGNLDANTGAVQKKYAQGLQDLENSTAIKEHGEDRAFLGQERKAKQGEMSVAQKRLDELNDPNSARTAMNRQLADRLDPKNAAQHAKMSGAELMDQFPILEKLHTTDMAHEDRKDMIALRREQIGAIRDQRSTMAQAKKDAALDKKEKEMAEALDPTKAKGGVLADRQKRKDASDRLEVLLTDPKGAEANLNSTQMAEAAGSLQSLISPGGHSADEVKHLTPQSAWGDAKKTIQWLKNEPQGADQQKFVRLMLDTAHRERDIVNEQIKEALIQRVSGFSGFKRDAPERHQKVMDAAGLSQDEIDEKGRYKKTSGHAQAKPDAPTRAKALKAAGKSNKEIADALNAEGY